MDQLLEGITGEYTTMDDVLVASRDTEHHDQTLNKVAERATRYKLKVNPEQLHITQSGVSCVGHLLTAEGLKPDPAKVKVVQEMSTLQNKDDVRRFLVFATHLGKYGHIKHERRKCSTARSSESRHSV